MTQNGQSSRFSVPVTSMEAAEAWGSAQSGKRRLLWLSAVIALLPVMMMLFVLLLFDVAVPGHHAATVIGLGALIIVLAGFQLALRLLRGRMLSHLGTAVLASLTPRLDDAAVQAAQTGLIDPDSGASVPNDVDAIRAFAGQPASALLDLMIVPVSLLALLTLHPWFALAALIGVVIAGALLRALIATYQDQAARSEPIGARRNAALAGTRDAPELVRTLGIRGRAGAAWQIANTLLQRQDAVSGEVQSRLTMGLDAVRIVMFVAILTIGAALAIADRASMGVVFAAGWLIWAAFEPIRRTGDALPVIVAARRGWDRIDAILAAIPRRTEPLVLPVPVSTLDAEGVAFAAPGMKRPIVHGVTFSLTAGQVLAVLGPAGAGKSGLLRALSGYWPTGMGKIRLDGAALDQFGPDRLAEHVGYLPQSVGLFDGTVAENIARFDPDARPDDVIAAAKAIGAHEMIVRLPDGYSTRVGSAGSLLSASQAQRVAIARAFYRDPFVIILDEPTSNLDPVGEKQILDAVKAARERGKIVILGGNANSLVIASTHVLIIQQGTMSDFGERDAVRQRVAVRRKQAELASAGSSGAGEQAGTTPQQESATAP